MLCVISACEVQHRLSAEPHDVPFQGHSQQHPEHPALLGRVPGKGDEWFWRINSGFIKDSYNVHLYLLP